MRLPKVFWGRQRWLDYYWARGKPEWMRVKPPTPDFMRRHEWTATDFRAEAEWMLSPAVSEEEIKAYRRESQAIRSSITGICCVFDGVVVPLEIFADADHPIYEEDIKRLETEYLYAHGCEFALQAAKEAGRCPTE